MAQAVIQWIPHPAQLYILQSKARFKTIVCGRRFGKTEMILNHFIRCAWEKPGDYVYIAPKRNQAKRIAWRKLKKFFPGQMKIDSDKWKSEAELWIENQRGGRILLLGADDPETLRGEGWIGVALDEFADMDPYVVEVIRASIGENQGFIWFVGTPRGYNHFYERYIKDKKTHDPNYRDENDQAIKIDKDYESFKYKTADNPFFPAKEIAKSKKEMTDEMFRQEFEASFENYTGLIYKEFMMFKNELVLETIYNDQGKIVGCKKGRETILFKEYWQYYIGLDTGRYTGCLLKAVDEFRNEYIIREIYDVDGLVRDIARQIQDEMELFPIESCVIDSASQVKREYEKQGIYFTDSQKDILASIQRTRAAMKQKKWFILDNCRVFLKELGARKWSIKKNRTGKPLPEKENDHLCNCEDYLQNTFLIDAPDIVTPEKIAKKKTIAYMTMHEDVSEPAWTRRG